LFLRQKEQEKELLSALITGCVFGLSSGLAPGPLLVLVITQAIKHNTREGIKVAAAPLITDLPIILVSLFLLTRLDTYHRALAFISIAGGMYVLYLSYECFRTKPVTLGEMKTGPQSLKKGVLINLFNPHPYLFWLTFGGPFLLKVREAHSLAPFAFLFSFYLSLIASEVFLALISGRSRQFLKSKAYLLVMRILALTLALFAFFLIKDTIHFLGAST
jgi:threonine/homoserine/homoserine lactone efflux protein